MKLVEVIKKDGWYTEDSPLDGHEGVPYITAARAYLAEFNRLLVYVGESRFGGKPMVVIAPAKPKSFMRKERSGHNAKTLNYIGRFPTEKAWEVFDLHRRMI